ncbi:hypothetical protein DMI80_02240 [Akkermansia muciniphila]|uniref:hypothetical protein n=1 Tax=Akkermansia muciniphila TaxID=239935 RepID=UPI00138E64D1|nr:hypothetical protein [Akkermansia muciniphila]QHV64806.1 hypothetical protein DMI78_02235 [Akkermansia muciniphila]QHV67254.1 hypothetical protein DMI79_02230 [Akkermansia muciniphila]QHV69722.1 hypothetical protein DMI80_02240 [Akkermansia muciniphila]QHV72175.1 hypothetical protein DMI81_02240 [Akkermansia muciniphila]
MNKKKHTRKAYSLTIPGKADISHEISKISAREELPSLPDGQVWLCTGGVLTRRDRQTVTKLNFLSGSWSKVKFG